MKAVVFAGKDQLRVEDVPEPAIQQDGDAIVRVTKSSICGSDLHVLTGKTPGMRPGSIVGHEFVGVVADAGRRASIPVDRRVVGSFLIACGRCTTCTARRYNHCRNRRALGLGTSSGDLDGAQAEYVRVPDAGINLHPLDESLADESALFAGDILTTGFYAVDLAAIRRDETVLVVGGGPVGAFCALVASGHTSHVIVLEQDPQRARLLESATGLDVIRVEGSARDHVAEATSGAMADVAIEAVGSVDALKTAMHCVREAGRVVIVGVYGADRYDLPLGAVWVRGLDLRFAGMANIQAHWDAALDAVADGVLDPVAMVTHRLPLAEAVGGYELFRSREALKVVLSP